MTEEAFFIKLQELIGPKGLSLFQKSLSKASLSADKLQALDVLPRAVLSWLYKTLESNKEFNGKVPGTECFLSLKKNQSGFEGVLKLKEQRININHTMTDIGSILTALAFEVNLFKSDIDFNQIQNILNTLVTQFHFEIPKKSFLIKNDSATCPDCGEPIKLREIGSRICICYSVLGNKNLHVMKNEDGTMKVSFGKNWDNANIKLFLRALENTKK